MIRVLFSLLLLIFYLICSHSAYAGSCSSEASGLCCRGWLNGDYAGIATSDSGMSYRDTSVDKIGVKGQCNDYFPTWGERTKLERTSNDPFTAEYEVTRQYCWARFVLSSPSNCGGPKLEWCHKFIFYYPCGWDWDDPNYVSWGDTRQRSVSIEQLLANECETVTMLSGVNKSEICLVKPKQDYKHGGTNNTKKNKVCAYYQPWFLSGMIGRKKYEDNLIGCVDVPFNPAPNVFNTSIPSGTEPWVDTSLTLDKLMKTYGSRFDQPSIVLKAEQMDITTDTVVAEELVLRYRFKDDTYVYPSSTTPFNNATVCGKFYKLETKYCAFVPDNQQDTVCVCHGADDKDECLSYNPLGCVARPSPKQSDIEVTGRYVVWEDELGNQYPAIDLSMMRKYDKQKLPLPQSSAPLVVPEYYKKPGSAVEDKGIITILYTISRGGGLLYGLNFRSIIPSFDDKDEMKTVKAIGAQSNYAMYQCPVCTLSIDQSFPDSFLFGGMRDTALCCPDSIREENKNQQCLIPPHPKSCPPVPGLAAPLIPNADAENAICPGIYQGPSASVSKPDKICAIYDDPWNAYKPSTPYCVDMPKDCLSIDTPSEASGLAIWRPSAAGEAEEGICDASYGFTNRENLLLSCSDCEKAGPDSSGSAASGSTSAGDTISTSDIIIKNNTLASLKNVYKSLRAILAPLNTNVTPSALGMLSGVKETELASFVNKEVAPPKNQCIGNIFHKGLQGSCARLNKCSEITNASPANGNMLVADSTNDWKVADPSRESSDIYTFGTQNIQIFTSVIPIYGACPAGYKASQSGATPTLQCVSKYVIKDGAKVLIAQTWAAPMNGCIKKD